MIFVFPDTNAVINSARSTAQIGQLLCIRQCILSHRIRSSTLPNACPALNTLHTLGINLFESNQMEFIGQFQGDSFSHMTDHLAPSAPPPHLLLTFRPYKCL
jgi:hypothetical protein